VNNQPKKRLGPSQCVIPAVAQSGNKSYRHRHDCSHSHSCNYKVRTTGPDIAPILYHRSYNATKGISII